MNNHKKMSRINNVGGKDINQAEVFFMKLSEENILSSDSLSENERKNIENDINYYKIKANDLFCSIEAKIFNIEQQQNQVNYDIVELIKSSLNESIEKIKQTQNKLKKNNQKIINEVANEDSKIINNKDLEIIQSKDYNINTDSKNDIATSTNKNIVFKKDGTENKKLKFDTITYFDNDKHIVPSLQRNEYEIKLNFYDQKNTEEYLIVHSNDSIYNDEYKVYFSNVKELFKKNYLELIGQESTTFDIDKFILLVLFENMQGKGSLSDVAFFDPLNNFKRYKIRDEDIPTLKDYYFFDGQIVMIDGIVDNTNNIALKDIKYGFIPEAYSLDYNHVKQFYKKASPYCIYALYGPFYPKEDLNLNVFVKAMKKIAEDKPHLIIIGGPIVNIENTLIKDAEIKTSQDANENINYFELFEIFLIKINEIFKDLITNIIICPSLLDVTNIYPLPQPAFNTKFLKCYNNLDIVKKGRMKMICNPNTFSVNEMIVGIANFDFTKEMIRANITNPNKIPIDSCLEMILSQKSYFPLLPSLIYQDDSDKTIILDYSKLNNLRINETPDIVFTTSSMKPFAKKIYSTLFINSGSFYKGNELGNFSRILSYAPLNERESDIFERLRVDIMKVSLVD